MGWFDKVGSGFASIDPTTTTGLANLTTGGLYSVAQGAGDLIDDKLLGGDAADAANRAARTAAEGQQNQLAYLQEINKIPQAFLEQAMQQYGGYYGIGYDPETGETISVDPTMPTQEERIALAESSPLYQSIMGGQAAGEEALARTRSATGGLRGGATASSLATFGSDLKNQALMSGYNEQLRQEQQQQQGLGTLMGMPTYGSQIGQTMGNIGQTLAQGQIAGANARNQATGQLLSLGGQIGAAGIMSDQRLKTNIKKVDDTNHPKISMYEWDWLPISGKEGYEDGFIAQEIEAVWPDLVYEEKDGYKRIMKKEIEQRLKELN